jgi:hypothetical protein
MRSAGPGPRPGKTSPRKTKSAKGKNKKIPLKKAARSQPLTSFHYFEKLPIELRVMIWNITVVPRVVEVTFSQDHGIYSRTITPIALRICPDSRSAVIHAYPTCFGNFLYQPRTLFNFSLDTLYFHSNMYSEVMLLFSGLKPEEATRLERIAISETCNEDWYDGEEVAVDAFHTLRMVVPTLPALQGIQLVYDLAMWTDAGVDEGDGAMRLYKKWPDYLMMDHIETMQRVRGMCSCGECYGFSDEDVDFDEFECHCGEHDLPDPDRPHSLGGIEGVELTSVWGWRPVFQLKSW